MQDKIDLAQMAGIVTNEAELLYCTIDEAWEEINSSITNQFDFEEVKDMIKKLNSEFKYTMI